MQKVPVAIVGASGYAGAELVRLCAGHPRIAIAGLYAHRHAGEKIADHFPQFAGVAGLVEGAYRAYDPDAIAAEAKVVFLALPHGESAKVAKELYARGLRVLDLSADFRLRSQAEHEAWYGPHGAPELIAVSRYGLVERHREELKGARLIAVPGCYPTAALLALAPLLAARLISPDGLIVDAKSGVSGAGRSPSLATHFAEAGEGVRAYKVAEHRHTPEIEEELGRAAGREVRLTFTPHLLPMSRGILATCYAAPTDENRERADYLAALREAYAREPFVAVVDRPPDTAFVRGSNRVQVSVWIDRRAHRVIAVGAIDNLVKGAAGQALQCLNVAEGWPETDGLAGAGVFP
ncbi:MAG TPA: N-acetyl-gamma-glutamyl-phosphate reductase [Polyangia bacterium]|jgi:N-acetyl-gamma-glutamyl-phosphate reductase